MHPTALRHRLDRFIHHPWTEVAILALITLSVGLMLLEIAYADQPGPRSVFEELGVLLTGVFVVELTIRYWVARKKRRFFQRYWLDILAVLPVIRPFRMLRILRVLRIFRAGVLLNRRMSAFGSMFRGAGTELTALAAFTITLVLTAATVLHATEGGSNADFASFDQSLWYAFLSVVGGEPIGGEPTTEVGRWATAALMIGGLTVFGMFVGTVSAAMVARLSRRLEVTEMDLDELTGHVVVCGWNRAAPTVLRELFAPDAPADRAVVVVTEQSTPPADLPEDGIRPEHLYHLPGDPTRVEVLEQAGITRAACAVLLADTLTPRPDQDRDARTVLAALTIATMAPAIYTIAELTSHQSTSLLKMAGVEEIVVGDWYAGKIVGSAIRNRGLVNVLDEVLTSERGNTFHTVPVPPGHGGRTVAELHQELLVRHQAILVSHVRGGSRGREVAVNPPADLQVAAGDALVVLAARPVRL